MIVTVRPDATTALDVVKSEVSAALRAVTAIAAGGELVYEDDFGSRFVRPLAFESLGHTATSLGLIAAAEGLGLAFSDEEGSSFEVRDLEWAADNLRTLAADLEIASPVQLRLPADDRIDHIRRAVLREIARGSEIDAVIDDAVEMAVLRGSDLLDPQQRVAVDAPFNTDLLVNAGAGSGKTHMLSMRVARLVAQREVSADRCLVLTFSTAAREQIQERLNSFALSEHPALSQVDVRTIHSLGRRILSLAASAGKTRVRPGFHVVTDGRRTIGDGKPATAPLPFIEQYDRMFDGVTDGKSERARLTLYPHAIATLRMGHPRLGVLATPDELSTSTSVTVLDPRSGELIDLDATTVAAVWGRYAEWMASHNAIDFPGMVTEALQAVRAHPSLLRMAAVPYAHIFVDEFQDTSLAQNQLLFELAAQGAVLSCVGDGDQTIFSFAGADPRSLADFGSRLLERTGRVATVVPLERNYRSVPPIVDAAEAVIARNVGRLEKRMLPMRQMASTEPALTASRAPLKYGAPWLALQVRRLIDDGVQPSEIAVLFRKEGVRSRQESAVIQHLEKLAVPVTTDPHSAEGVRVLSIHQAKGSEFRHVLCLHLGPGHFPDARGDAEEERRLLYVAITRAKDSLVITGEPGADPDLFGEFIAGHADMNVTSVSSLTEVLTIDAIDESIMDLTNLDGLDPSILDWDEPE